MRRFSLLLTTAVCAWGTSVAPAADVRPAAPLAPRANVLTNDPWANVAKTPLTTAELDQLVAAELKQDGLSPAPRTTDEQFIRRVSLDLTGQLPRPADVREFVADTASDKRAKLVDRLLDSDEYAAHWANYWRDVVASRFTDRRTLAMVPSFEAWLEQSFQKNVPWDKMARKMLTANNSIKIAEPSADDGAAFFLLAHMGDDQTVDRTSEAARVFLGLQIQCAQCHDHPFDAWKQEQFHQLAGYFARLTSRPKNIGMPAKAEIALIGLPFGEHKMPDKDDPKKGTTVSPQFLNGKTLTRSASDKVRREALADEIVRDNFWFAAAFVNRTWGEMMGQAFSQPVDDLGPGRDVFLPGVLTRLAASFHGSQYDIKQLLRLICNSETYQRQIRPGSESTDSHKRFAASSPTRLPAEALWQSVVTALGLPVATAGDPRRRMPDFPGRRAPQSLEAVFVNEFKFDPSVSPDEVEGGIPQALLLMNNKELNEKMKVSGANVLARLLQSHPKDEDAVKTLYLRVLSRQPSERELNKSLKFIRSTSQRAEAYEDLLWALMNSTEFLTQR